MSDDGLVTLASAHSISDTISRFEAALETHGVTVFATIDHAAGAAEAGMPLRPTTLLIFGNARAGTPLMQADQRIGLDLPLKALVWQDSEGKVWITYNEPAWLAARHSLGSGVEQTVEALGNGLAALAKAAAGA
jgi:uncharacterized protein (DUF302 family)